MKEATLNFYAPGTCGYTPIDGKLTRVTVSDVEIRLNEPSYKYHITLPNGSVAEMNKWDKFKLYDSEKKYEEGVCSKQRTMDIHHLLNNCLGVQVKLVDGCVIPHVLVFENGDCVDKELNIEVVKVESRFECDVVVGDKIPEETYKSRQDAFDWNDYTVVESDGSKHEVKSIKKKMALSDEQVAVMKKLEQSLKEVKDAGIALAFDYERESFYAVNNNGLKLESMGEWDYGKQDEKERDTAQYVGSDDASHFYHLGVLYDYFMNCEYGMAAKFSE